MWAPRGVIGSYFGYDSLLSAMAFDWQLFDPELFYINAP
jgi:hypothetical protein